jgi:FkbM family methyltransferase
LPGEKMLKRILIKTVMHMPWTVKREVFLLLSKEYGWEGLTEVAQQQGVDGFVVHGDYGAVSGLVHDKAILAAYAKTGTWAKEFNTLLFSFLEKGGTYLDIGGNIGLTTIPVAQNTLVNCHVFEPMPAIFDALSSNVRRFPNVTTHNLAVHREDALLVFEGSPNNGGDNRIATGSFEHTIEVQGRRLDGISIEVSGPLVAKIDTQGAEPFVIEGGIETLSKASLIAMEYWPIGMSRLGGDKNIVLDFLAAFPLGCALMGDTASKIEWHPMDEVLASLDHKEDGTYYDIYAAKEAIYCPV